MTTLLATTVPPEMAKEADKTVAFLRSDAPLEERSAAAYELIYALSELSIESVFLGPIEVLGLGAVTKKLAQVTAAAALSGFKSALARITKKLTDEQLRAVADQIEGRLYEMG